MTPKFFVSKSLFRSRFAARFEDEEDEETKTNARSDEIPPETTQNFRRF